MANYSYTSSGGAIVGYDGILRDDLDDPVLDSAGQYVETDTYFYRLRTFIGGGGAVCSGVADISTVVPGVFVASGGAVCGVISGTLLDGAGDAILDDSGNTIETDSRFNKRAPLEPSGGSVVSGSADVSRLSSSVAYSFQASGGAVVGHGDLLLDNDGNPISDGYGNYVEITSLFFRVVNAASAGGCVSGAGVIDVLKSASFVASGGSVSGGSSQGGTALVASGGALCSGSATVLRGEVSPGSGGAVVAGDAVSAKISQFSATRGGVAGGSVSGGKSQFVSAQDGVVCGGSASLNLSNIKQYSAQGGAVFGSGTLITDNNGEPLLDGSGNPIDAETLFTLRRTTVVSGGAVVAGSYTTANSIAFVASGGAVCEGYSAFRFNDLDNDQYVSRGGCVIDAQATFSCSRAQEFSGGAVAASQATVAIRDVNPCSDGALIGADTVQAFSRSIPATGGTVAGGDSSRAMGVAFEASGGTVAAGTGAATRLVSLAALGGSECGDGSAHSAFKGTNVSGGALAQGQSDFSITGYADGLGGAVLGGAAGYSAAGGQNQTQTGDGGAVCQGDAGKLVKASSQVSRGAIAGGDTLRGKGYLYNPSGGAVVNGVASFSVAVAHDYSTGAVGGGNAVVLINGGQNITHIASGGPVISGSADVNRKVFPVSSLGVVCNGVADYLFAIALADDYSNGVIGGGEAVSVSEGAGYTPVHDFYRREQSVTFYRKEQALEFYPPVRIVEFELEAAA